MEYLQYLILFFVLFVSTFALWWLFTCCWIFGPVLTMLYFVGAVGSITLLGVIAIDRFNSPRN